MSASEIISTFWKVKAVCVHKTQKAAATVTFCPASTVETAEDRRDEYGDGPTGPSWTSRTRAGRSWGGPVASLVRGVNGERFRQRRIGAADDGACRDTCRHAGHRSSLSMAVSFLQSLFHNEFTIISKSTSLGI
jgi:hypothetical protein